MDMHCLRPIRIYENHDGVKTTTYKPKNATSEGYVPCGYCFPCLKEKRRQWSIRLYLESLMHTKQCFVTLTYKDAPLSVSKRDCQLFLKKLRKYLKQKITYFLVAEYGSKTQRAHYHLILYGHDFKDELSFNISEGLYSHPKLEGIWEHGMVSIGGVTPASINYVASYTQKKLSKIQNDRFFNKINGEIREREFNLMSIRPAIGRRYYEAYKQTLIDNPYVIIDGKKVNIPNYFDRISDNLFNDQKVFSTEIIDNDPDIHTKIEKSEKLSRAAERTLREKDLL